MEIKWHGHTCFTFKEKKTTLTINPDKEAGTLKTNIVLSSLEDKTAEVKDAEKVFTWPGEYEVAGVPIIGLQAWTKSLSEEEKDKSKGEPTIIFYFEIGGVKVCHLGELGHVLSSDMVKEIGDVDILLMNGGKGSNLGTKKAIEVLEAIDPKMVIPMGNGNMEEFLKELGVEDLTPKDSLDIKSPSELPNDKREYVVLKKVKA